ncbi:hypothetical protein HK096_001426, partial [Nowakowskiella sp. JEL0078]
MYSHFKSIAISLCCLVFSKRAGLSKKVGCFAGQLQFWFLNIILIGILLTVSEIPTLLRSANRFQNDIQLLEIIPGNIIDNDYGISIWYLNGTYQKKNSYGVVLDFKVILKRIL